MRQNKSGSLNLKGSSQISDGFSDIHYAAERERLGSVIRVLAPSGRGGEFTQPRLRLLAEYCSPVGPPCNFAEGLRIMRR